MDRDAGIGGSRRVRTGLVLDAGSPAADSYLISTDLEYVVIDKTCGSDRGLIDRDPFSTKQVDDEQPLRRAQERAVKRFDAAVRQAEFASPGRADQ